MSAIGVEAHSPYTSYSQNNSTFIGDRLAEGSSASNVSLFAQRKLAALRWLSQEEARESALGEEARKASASSQHNEWQHTFFSSRISRCPCALMLKPIGMYVQQGHLKRGAQAMS
eukprot:6193936-Pleurochrysis_carterae.AAC.1